MLKTNYPKIKLSKKKCKFKRCKKSKKAICTCNCDNISNEKSNEKSKNIVRIKKVEN